MRRTRRGQRYGTLRALRRWSGLGAFLFAVVVLVGTARAHALALVSGDDELCVAMGFAGVRTPVPASDPTDLADRHHACCDLGLCLDGSALTPTDRPHAAPRRIVRHRTRLAPAPSIRRPRRAAANRPRGPPAI